MSIAGEHAGGGRGSVAEARRRDGPERAGARPRRAGPRRAGPCAAAPPAAAPAAARRGRAGGRAYVRPSQARERPGARAGGAGPGRAALPPPTTGRRRCSPGPGAAPRRRRRAGRRPPAAGGSGARRRPRVASGEPGHPAAARAHRRRGLAAPGPARGRPRRRRAGRGAARRRRPPRAGRRVHARAPRRRADAGRLGQPAGVGRGDGELTTADVRRVWPELLKVVRGHKRTTEALLKSAQVHDLANGVLTLAATSPGAGQDARRRPEQGRRLRQALLELLGVRWKVQVVVEGVAAAAGRR